MAPTYAMEGKQGCLGATQHTFAAFPLQRHEVKVDATIQDVDEPEAAILVPSIPTQANTA